MNASDFDSEETEKIYYTPPEPNHSMVWQSLKPTFDPVKCISVRINSTKASACNRRPRKWYCFIEIIALYSTRLKRKALDNMGLKYDNIC